VQVKWTGILEHEPAQPVINKEKTLLGYGKPLEAPSHGTDHNQKNSYWQVPQKIPPIFDGSQLIVFGVFPSEIAAPSGVEITALSPDGPLSISIELLPENEFESGSNKMIHKLAAIKAIR
jgi:hypothetical protein